MMTRWDKLAQIEAERKQQTDYAVQNSLDAERYRKLKAEMLRNPLHLGSVKRKGDFVFLEGQFDAAVDALEDVTK